MNLNTNTKIQDFIFYYYYVNNQTDTDYPASQATLIPLALVCLFGVITNLINVMVFVNPRITDKCFKYMLASSISDFIYLSLFLIDYFILHLFCVSRCFTVSHSSHSYTVQLIFFLVNDYFSSSLAFFNILTDILLSLKRLMIVTNKYYVTWISYKVAIPFCYFVALLVYSPVLILKEVKECNSTPNSTLYTTVPTKFSQSNIGTATPIILSSIRIFLAIVVLSTVNIITTTKLKNQLMKKLTKKETKSMRIQLDNNKNIDFSDTMVPLSSLGSRSFEQQKTSMKMLKDNAALKASKNITLMVVWTMNIYIFGNIPYTLAYVFGFFFEYSEKLHMFTTVSKALLFLAHGVNFFIYFAFNTIYRDVFFCYLINAKTILLRK